MFRSGENLYSNLALVGYYLVCPQIAEIIGV